MTRFLRCDNCYAVSEPFQRYGDTPDAWFAVELGRDCADFCSLRCLSDYVTAKNLLDSAEEP